MFIINVRRTNTISIYMHLGSYELKSANLSAVGRHLLTGITIVPTIWFYFSIKVKTNTHAYSVWKYTIHYNFDSFNFKFTIFILTLNKFTYNKIVLLVFVVDINLVRSLLFRNCSYWQTKLIKQNILDLNTSNLNMTTYRSYNSSRFYNFNLYTLTVFFTFREFSIYLLTLIYLNISTDSFIRVHKIIPWIILIILSSTSYVIF